MRTIDKVQKMFYKAAAAKRFNSKIMQKRAALANRPSDAYLAGFCKTAEDMGVDPEELLKMAGLWDRIKGGFNNLVNGAKNFGSSVVNGAKAVGGALWNGAKNYGSNLAQGLSAPFRGIQAVGAGLGSMAGGGGFMNGMKSSWNNGVNKINGMFGANGGARMPSAGGSPAPVRAPAPNPQMAGAPAATR